MRVILPVDVDHASVRLDGAGDDFDQRGFACAIFAQQRMDFSLDKIQRDLVERQHAGVLLGDVS